MNRKDRRAGKNGPTAAKTPGLQADTVAQQKAQLIEQALKAAGELIHYNKFADAERVYKGILEHDPLNISCYYNMGVICRHLGRTDEAYEWIQKSLSLNPRDTEALSVLAGVYLEQGKTEEAMAASLKSVTPHSKPSVLTDHGNLLMEMGKIDEAIDFFNRALRQDPDQIRAYCGITSARKMKKDDPEIAQMLRLEKSSADYAEETLVQLQFALAKTFYDLKDYDASFDYYARANALKDKTYRFSPKATEQFLNNVRNIFTTEFVKNHTPGGTPSNRPIFIVGMPRSGTSLVEQILASHPDVHGAGELKNLYDALGAEASLVLPDLKNVSGEISTSALSEKCLSPDFMKNMGLRYLESVAGLGPDKPRLSDKMPFNFVWVGFIRLALPNAKIIHCTRDPVDTGLSVWRQNFSGNIPWASNQRHIAQYYKSYKRMMDFWEQLFPGDIFEANYETVVADQESQTRRLLEFCGLDWDDRCLDFHKVERQVKTASLAQVRQPIYADSVKAWKKFEKHLLPMIEELEKP